MSNQAKTKKRLSNEAVDAISAVIIIGVAVFAVVYWLNGMPS